MREWELECEIDQIEWIEWVKIWIEWIALQNRKFKGNIYACKGAFTMLTMAAQKFARHVVIYNKSSLKWQKMKGLKDRVKVRWKGYCIIEFNYSKGEAMEHKIA